MFKFKRGFSPEVDAINDAHQQLTTGGYEDEPATVTKVTRTGDTPWTLVDGIRWNQERLIWVDGVPRIQLGIKDPGLSSMFATPTDTNTINRVLVRFMPDGALRELLVDFTPPYLEHQNPAGTVVHECPQCKRLRAIIAGWKQW